MRAGEGERERERARASTRRSTHGEALLEADRPVRVPLLERASPIRDPVSGRPRADGRDRPQPRAVAERSKAQSCALTPGAQGDPVLREAGAESPIPRDAPLHAVAPLVLPDRPR